MRKGLWIIFLFCLLPAGSAPLLAQFTAEELAQRERWEEFLKTAEVVAEEQISGREAVTSPWTITLKSGDVTHRAIWKNPEGRMGGYIEGWKYEIAAYLLDKHLGLNMIPPTVEKRLHENRGSCQLWVDDVISLREKTEKKIKTPPLKVFGWNRSTYLQRAFDNLIANEDRHMNQILITNDFRMLLIDHSRSFRTTKKFIKELIYTEKHKEGPKLMSELPRTFVDKIKGMDFDIIKSVVGDYLSDEEINGILSRKELILAEIDRLIQKNGEDKVLY